MELAAKCDLYLITQCDEDEVEEQVIEALRNAGLFDLGLNPCVSFKATYSNTRLMSRYRKFFSAQPPLVKRILLDSWNPFYILMVCGF